MKYELTISTSCVPNWGIWEGCREIIQNAKDESIANNHEMKVEYNKKNETLIVINEGAFLPKKVMLYGFSDKRENNKLIGMFGEGLKLGTIALLNNNINLKIRSQDELWQPQFESSGKFENEKVLIFDIKKRTKKDQVKVEMSPIPESIYTEIKNKILFLKNEEVNEIKGDHYGSIILNSELTGNIYAKGIFISHEDNYKYAYNLPGIEIDRDRKMAKPWSLKFNIRCVWEYSKQYDLIFEELVNNTYDFTNFDSISYNKCDEFAKEINKRFLNHYGFNSFPVTSISELDEISHHAKKGIIVSSALKNILSPFHDLDELREDYRNNIEEEISLDSLSIRESKNFNTAIELLKKTDFGQFISDISIVKFRDMKLYGTFDNGKIKINIIALSDIKLVLMTLVEEIAHNFGSHDSSAFKESLHNMYTNIIKLLLNKTEETAKLLKNSGVYKEIAEEEAKKISDKLLSEAINAMGL